MWWDFDIFDNLNFFWLQYTSMHAWFNYKHAIIINVEDDGKNNNLQRKAYVDG